MDEPSTTNANNTPSRRTSCPYGEDCYRTNPNHRLDHAHPGDSDYKSPRLPSPVANAPNCKYGRQCYRKNYNHYRNFRHPRKTNSTRASRNTVNNDSNDEAESEEDPFADSSGSDYIPSEDDD
ncbi:uncharacterized protein LOC142224348 [Haematobia irritans]|uniref:uncharacterized protein LOC142224348 n=1 Tax=Haematobia irritans TaxID=7368 RepID=UPI003F501278